MVDVTAVTNYIWRFLVGFGGSLFLLFMTVFLVPPLLLYRWFILKMAAPFFGPSDLREAVNPLGNGMAHEFRKAGQDVHRSQQTLVSTIVLEGNVTFPELYDSINEKWIEAQTETRELRFPELQQYFAAWMGLMFFMQEKDFKLEQHVKLHVLDEHGSTQASETFCNKLQEMLLNQSWKAGISPWEVHLIQNFRPCNQDGGEQFSAILCRTHHALGDGFASVHLLYEQLFGNIISADAIPRPASNSSKSGIFQKPAQYVKLFVSMVHALGCVISMTMARRSIAFRCQDSMKSGTHFGIQGPEISVAKNKFIKNHFGVSFASVLDSALAAALGKALNAKMGRNMPKTIPHAVAVPLPNHPKKLRNHAAGMAYELPVSLWLDPVARVLECERNMSQVKIRPFLLLLCKLSNAFIGGPIYLSMLLYRKGFIVTGASASNLPVSSHQLMWDKRKIISNDVLSIPGPVVGAVTFLAISYSGTIRLSATAEKGIMSREDLEQIFVWVEQELGILYELALEVEYGDAKRLSPV